MPIKQKLPEKPPGQLLAGKSLQLLTFFTTFLLMSGCVSSSLDTARFKFVSGDSDTAVAVLKDCQQTYSKDRLLCLMEMGSILFLSNEFRQSTEALLKASTLIKEQDQISIIDQSTAIVVSDNTMEYKGEYAERLWVHSLLMMNFLLLGDAESALVEAKQALELYDRFPEALEHADFTRALIGLCYENMGKFDDANIEYQKLQEDGEAAFHSPAPSNDEVEVVLFVTMGTIPPKISRDIVIPPSVRISLPAYAASPSPPKIRIHSETAGSLLTVTSDLGLVARLSLKTRVAELVTRQAIRVGTKETLVQAAGHQDDLAGVMVRLILFLAEQADTRSWQTLPGSLTISRIRLLPGENTIQIYNNSDQFLSQISTQGGGGQRLYYLIDL